MQELEFFIGWNLQQPIGFGHPAGHLGQELGSRDADRDLQPDLVQHPLAQPDGNVNRAARHPAQASDVKEGLVDRQPLDQWCGLREHFEDRPAGRGVGRESRRYHDRVGADPPCGETAHRRPHAERLGLVAGGQHNATADDHRLSPQTRIVALLHRCEERIEIRMQNARLFGHEHMFA